MSDAHAVTPDLDTLVALFYARAADLGRFDEVESRELARDYRMLLAHDSHMTVTVERFHNGPVDVRVLDSQLTGTHYARKIVLTRQADGAVVQFGIMRLDFSCVSPEVRREVESRSTPLGRILIQHNVLREVHLTQAVAGNAWRRAAPAVRDGPRPGHVRPHGDHPLRRRAGRRIAGNRGAGVTL